MDSTVYSSNHNRNKKGILIGVIMLALVIGLVILGSSYLNKSGSPIGQTNTLTQPASSTLELPIPLDDPAIKQVGLTYSLNGKIGSIRPIPNGELEFTFIGSGGNMVTGGPLIITDKIPVSKSASGSARLRLNDLKNEDNVTVNYFYDPVKKKGQATSIQLVE